MDEEEEQKQAEFALYEINRERIKMIRKTKKNNNKNKNKFKKRRPSAAGKVRPPFVNNGGGNIGIGAKYGGGIGGIPRASPPSSKLN